MEMKMLSYLKVKIKSLAAESVIIRKQELKVRDYGRYLLRNQKPAESTYSEFNGLREHRRGIVRSEARAAQLAYGYIRGRKYSQVEKLDSEWGYGLTDKALKLIVKYGPPLNKEDREALPDKFKEWLKS